MVIRCEGKTWRNHGSVWSPTCPRCRSEAQEIQIEAENFLYAYRGVVPKQAATPQDVEHDAKRDVGDEAL